MFVQCYVAPILQPNDDYTVIVASYECQGSNRQIITQDLPHLVSNHIEIFDLLVDSVSSAYR